MMHCHIASNNYGINYNIDYSCVNQISNLIGLSDFKKLALFKIELACYNQANLMVGYR